MSYVYIFATQGALGARGLPGPRGAAGREVCDAKVIPLIGSINAMIYDVFLYFIKREMRAHLDSLDRRDWR